MSSVDENKAFYGRVSDGRDDYWRKMAAPRFRVATLLSLLAEDAPRGVVDLGCGGGQLLEELHRACPDARLLGVDLSEDQMARNRQAFPAAAFLALDLDAKESLDGPLGEHEGAFDAVVAMELIEHVSSPETLLGVARRLVRPGGRLLLSTQSGPVRATERRVGHQRHFTAEAMTGLLVRAGFRPERVWNAGFPFHDLSKRLANLDPDRAIARFDGRAYGPLEDLACLGLRALFRLNSRSRGAQLFATARRP